MPLTDFSVSTAEIFEPDDEEIRPEDIADPEEYAAMREIPCDEIIRQATYYDQAEYCENQATHYVPDLAGWFCPDHPGGDPDW